MKQYISIYLYVRCWIMFFSTMIYTRCTRSLSPCGDRGKDSPTVAQACRKRRL